MLRMRLSKGQSEAVKEKQNLKVLLVGQKEVVEKELSAYDYPKERIEVIHASEVIETGEPPVDCNQGKERFFDCSRNETGQKG